jgi:dCMP deaminase
MRLSFNILFYDHWICETRIMRKPWNTYFMELAEKIAERSTCDRAHVGCILVKDNRIISSGYNGSLRGQEHCDQIGHLMIDNHCVKTVHAESNAIAQAAKYGNSIDGATCYCTHLPCLNCLKLLISSGISKIYYNNEYRPDTIPDEFKNVIPIIKINTSNVVVLKEHKHD